MKYCKHNSDDIVLLSVAMWLTQLVKLNQSTLLKDLTAITTGALKLSNVDTHVECDFGEYNRTQCCSSSIISSYQFKNSQNNYH
ncbi:hypothetical protein DERP_006301 [Dermatophagoides pteronyssinus]|uniref:Uncharacterized protein n=1 Tax=Dermatophagoides pteronyssinus TaxID=6956 RepID=A0ABQ8IY21_DERPT|nr:hypothetical protein DERP_006301 [Dermatophagoides pteronyssinus]